MAGPVAHIICALTVLQSGALTIKDPKAFIIGTSFPDIRYLANLPRTATHPHTVTWNEIQNAKTDFEKGMLFHSLVDDVRVIQLEHDVLHRMPYTPFMKGYLLKCFEDYYLYDQLRNWDTVCAYFDDVLPEEMAYGASESQVRAWHRFIQTYCHTRPTASHIQHIFDTTPHFSMAVPFSPPSFLSKGYIALVFYRISHAHAVLTRISNFYQNIVQHTTTEPYAKSAQATHALGAPAL